MTKESLLEFLKHCLELNIQAKIPDIGRVFPMPDGWNQEDVHLYTDALIKLGFMDHSCVLTPRGFLIALNNDQTLGLSCPLGV